MAISISEQIKCVQREIALRERVYPRWIEKGRMTPVKATYEIEAMKAVLETLHRVLEDSDFELC